MDNLKVPWVLCPLEVPPRRARPVPGAEGPDVSGVPFHCCTCCLCLRGGDETRGEQECLLLEGWTWEQRPALQAPGWTLPAFRILQRGWRARPRRGSMPGFRQGQEAAPRLFLCQPGRRHRQWGPGHLSWPRSGPWGHGRSTSPRLFSEKGTWPGAPKQGNSDSVSLLLGSRFCPSLSSTDLQTSRSDLPS